MLTDDARDLLEGGSALIIGLTKSDGRPIATRGWGFDVDPSGMGAVLLVRDHDAAALGFQVGEAPGIPIAVSAADPWTLSSFQVKGTLVDIRPPEPEDADRKERYCDAFIQAIIDVDGVHPDVAERWRATGPIQRWRIVFEELFVQTPGPGAGASVAKADR